MSNKLTNFNGGKITIANISKVLPKIEKTSRTLLLCGAPGIGKSAIIYKYAEDNDYDIYTFTGGLITRGNIYGVDFIDPNQGSSIHYPAEWYSKAIKSSKKVLLFLDDFANSNPQEMMVLQQILGDRKLGNYDLPPDKFIIVAATNRQEDNANVFSISSPIISRCSVLEVELSASEYLEYCKSNMHPSIYAFLDKRRWAISDDSKYLKINPVPGDITGYGAKEASFSTVHPCPRTWAAVSDMLYANQSDVLEQDNIIFFTELVSGLIGNSLAPLFIKSLKVTLKIPSIDTLIKNCKPSIDYNNLISSDIEAVSSVAFTLYQDITVKSTEFSRKIRNNEIVPEISKKGTPIYKDAYLESLFDVLNKIKNTNFDKGINAEAIITNIFDLVLNMTVYTDIISILRTKDYYKDYNNQKNIIDMALK